MARRKDQSDPYDEDYDDDYDRDDRPLPSSPVIHQAFDWGISGSILAIIVLTILYTISPVDFMPDIVPVAGQVDDLAAIVAGGSSVTLLATLRYLLRSRIGRWGCLVAIVLCSAGAFVVFWVLMQLVDRIL